MKEFLEAMIAAAILAQDAFWLMERMSDRALERLRRRWLQLADDLEWR